ncbi:hypothetical protein ACHAPT_005464 [Fusarium lateritium]
MLLILVFLGIWAFSGAMAKPTFLSNRFEIEQGKRFLVRYSGCNFGCNLTLVAGKASDLRDVKILSVGISGNETPVILADLGAGIYAFKLSDGEEVEYSAQFYLEGESDENESETATTSTTSESRIASSDESSDDSQGTATSTSSTLSTAAEETTTPPNPSKPGLGTGEIAGIAIGVVAAVLIVLGALFFWWRRRKQKSAEASTSNTDRGDTQPQLAELEQPKNFDIVVSQCTPAEMHGSTPPPPAAELAGQGRPPELAATEKETEEETYVATIVPKPQGEERRAEEELVGDVAAIVPELQGKETTAPSEIPTETAPKDNPQQQGQTSNPLIPELPSPSEEPQQKETNSPLAAQIQPEASSSTSSKPPNEAQAISPVSPISDEQTTQMLMEQYAQLEARRQRILELKTIEEEQAALRARLSNIQRGNGTEQ